MSEQRFGFLWRHHELSLADLAYVDASQIGVKSDIVVFKTDYGQRVPELAGLIKVGQVWGRDEAVKKVSGQKLVGVSSLGLGKQLKRDCGVKRFKLVKSGHVDREVAEAGYELVELGDEQIGLVESWQSIDRYSAIDYDKPARGMQVGMMPAKLTHLLLNIARAKLDQHEAAAPPVTVYDPFVGFGTTMFVANSKGYHTIGSDLNITPYKQNDKRRTTTRWYDSELKMTHFKHDATTPFVQPFLQHVDMIVTEGRLGPPIKSNQQLQDTAMMESYVEQIVELYSDFLEQVAANRDEIVVTMTIPVYLQTELETIKPIIAAATEQWWQSELVGLYQRTGQQVGRQVVTLWQ